jgi:hypothetical protein
MFGKSCSLEKNRINRTDALVRNRHGSFTRTARAVQAFKQITMTASISCSPESTTYLSGEVLEAVATSRNFLTEEGASSPSRPMNNIAS